MDDCKQQDDQAILTTDDGSIFTMANDNYDCGLILDAIKEQKSINVIKIHVKHFLNKYHEKDSATTLYHELMSTCQLWSEDQTEYLLTVLQTLVSLGVNVNNQLSQHVLTAMEAKNVLLLKFLKRNDSNFSFESLLHTLAEQKEYDESSIEFYIKFCDLLLSSNFDMNASENKGNSALHTAVVSGNIPMVGVLLEFDADVNCRNHNKMTPLQEAVRMNQSVELIELLVTSGAKVNVTNCKGETPLHFAVFNDNVNIVRTLIEHNALNIRDDNHQRTPLDVAVIYNKSIEIIELLLTKVADVNAKDYRGETPLTLAISQNNAPMVRSLIKRGAAINCEKRSQKTPLRRAVMLNKSLEIVELLLTKGADPNDKDFNGMTSLHFAASNANVSMMQVLLKAGADINSRDIEGNRPIHQVFSKFKLFRGSYANEKEVEVEEKIKIALKMLLHNRAYVNARNNQGETPLFIALSVKSFKLVAELLKYNADLYDSKLQILLHEATNYKVSGHYSAHMLRSFTRSEHRLVALSRFLRKYWLKLKFADLSFDKKYNDIINEIVDEETNDYELECSNEIKMLKDTSINNKISLFDYLHMHAKRRWDYVNNENLQVFVKSPSLEEQFPIYSDLILAGYRGAARRKILLEAKAAFYKLIEARLSDNLDQIFDYLDEADLVNIIGLND